MYSSFYTPISKMKGERLYSSNDRSFHVVLIIARRIAKLLSNSAAHEWYSFDFPGLIVPFG